MNKMNNKTCLIFLILGIVVYTIVFTSLCSLRYQAFFSYEWEDEAAENQLLWNTAHGDFLKQTIIKSNSFVDHFTPIYIVIAPIYRLFPTIYTFYFIFCLNFALGAIPLYFLTRQICKDDLKAALISFTYLLYPPLHWVNLSSVEPVMLSVPFLLFAFYLFHNGKFSPSIIFFILALMCKENVAFTVIAMGIYFIFKKYNFKWSLVITVLGIMWLFVSFTWIMPNIGHNGVNVFGNFYKGGFTGILKSFIFNPRETFQFMFSYEKLQFVINAYKPLMFFPLISLANYISLPVFMQILLFSRPPSNEAAYYLSGAIPFIFISLIFAIQKIDKLFKKIAPNFGSNGATCILILLLVVSFIGNLGDNIYGLPNKDYIPDKRFLRIHNIYDKKFYSMDDSDRIAWDLIKMIPKEASVSASGNLLVPLSHRKNIYEFAFDEVDDGGGYDYYDVDYIIIDMKNRYHGAGHYSFHQKKHLKKLNELVKNNTFDTLYKENNFLLLKRNK